MRKGALNRLPITEETRNKISNNSKVRKSYFITRVDNSLFLSSDGQMVQSLTLRTLNVVRNYLDCNEKTVRRALSTNGIVKKEWHIKVID